MFLTDNGACPEQPNTTPDIPPGPVESYRTVSVGWANASNTPYRKFKSTDYEGGIRTPFIAHWPAVIKPDTMTDQVGHIIDLSATFRDITGAEYPKEINGNKTKPPVGLSLLPIFEGKEREAHKLKGSPTYVFDGGRTMIYGNFDVNVLIATVQAYVDGTPFLLSSAMPIRDV